MVYINSNFDVSTIEELQKQNASLVKALKKKSLQWKNKTRKHGKKSRFK